MKIQFLLLCFLIAVIASLEDVQVFTVDAGEDFRNIFPITSEGNVTYLCRSPCQRQDMLMEVHGKGTKSGRFNLRRENQNVHVAITQVMKQDAGFYQVGTSQKHVEFQIIVKDLCDGGSTLDKKQEYQVTEGSNLEVTCDLPLHLRNRMFLCRGECSAYLINTNDPEGYSAKYSVEYIRDNSFKVIIHNLSARDAGQYRCGVGQGNSPNKCQQFTVTVSAGTGVALPIVITGLVILILILVIFLIHKWKKAQAPPNVNAIPTVPSSPADEASQSCYSGDDAYASLSPETRENFYDTLSLHDDFENYEPHIH